MDYEVDLVLQLLYFEALQKAVLKKRIRWRSRVKNKQTKESVTNKMPSFLLISCILFFFTFFVRSKHSGAWC